ncbi:dTDP-4-dehydrorhamnose reductase [Paenibacillus pectinilyticus]|uniref:dTDP-4-dehydrorhamnose reductase n=1 Tax=Paenibacillus pectinilyticus TaxID=512399 RepID=A0A1C1A0Q0_9BACL|nr:dTDP-4-dehydrorhamnose reductase [Paenibacillus pectinilyticus]OCT13999.1 dTDP-4-dehydrorhamnose reductase [Paenibacillus pectinilyticus]
MKIAITGAGGQLGYDLKRVLIPMHEVIAWNKEQLDITNEQEVAQMLLAARPEVVIHSAAYTNVDKAEMESERAYEVNAMGALHIAKACEEIGAKLVYVSTDYVFDGTKGAPYTEADTPNPSNVYGHSKLLGEKFVSLSCSKHFIVRTSWLYGKHGTNFVTKVIEKALAGGPLTIVDDQWGSPTYCLDLAIFLRELIDTELYGLYHASNEGECSRYEFAQQILLAAGLSQVSLLPVLTSDCPPAPAVRPMYSAFAHQAIANNGLTPLRDWQSALHFFLQLDYYDPALLKKKV